MDKQTIGIDGRMLTGELTGVGRYVFEIIQRVAKLMPDTRFIIYSPKPAVRFEAPNCFYKQDPSRFAAGMKPVVWTLFRSGRLASEDDCSVFWGPCHFLPFHLQNSVQRVLTVHDLVYRVCPSTMTAYQRLSHLVFFPSSLRRADLVAANSRGTADRLYRSFGRSADEIARPGISERWRKASALEIVAMREKYSIQGRYILAVSTIEPRKNYSSLVNAFVAKKQSGELRDHTLIIVGRKGWKFQSDVALILASREQGVTWMGYVDEADLAAIYSGADLFVCPSTYEGFGIPAVEARGCAIPMLLTDIPELREAGGPSATYSAPDDVSLARGMVELIQRGDVAPAAVGELPDWQDAARKYAQIFQQALRQSTAHRG